MSRFQDVIQKFVAREVKRLVRANAAPCRYTIYGRYVIKPLTDAILTDPKIGSTSAGLVWFFAVRIYFGTPVADAAIDALVRRDATERTFNSLTGGLVSRVQNLVDEQQRTSNQAESLSDNFPPSNDAPHGDDPNYVGSHYVGPW